MNEQVLAVRLDDGGMSFGRYVRASLVALGYQVQQTANDSIQDLVFKGKIFQIEVTIFCGDSYLTAQAYLPFIIPDEAVQRLLVQINELNTFVPIGSYEYRRDRTQVIFKVGYIIPPIPTRDELGKMLVHVVSSADVVSEQLYNLVFEQEPVATAR